MQKIQKKISYQKKQYWIVLNNKKNSITVIPKEVVDDTDDIDDINDVDDSDTIVISDTLETKPVETEVNKKMLLEYGQSAGGGGGC